MTGLSLDHYSSANGSAMGDDAKELRRENKELRAELARVKSDLKLAKSQLLLTKSELEEAEGEIERKDALALDLRMQLKSANKARGKAIEAMINDRAKTRGGGGGGGGGGSDEDDSDDDLGAIEQAAGDHHDQSDSDATPEETEEEAEEKAEAKREADYERAMAAGVPASPASRRPLGGALMPRGFSAEVWFFSLYLFSFSSLVSLSRSVPMPR